MQAVTLLAQLRDVLGQSWRIGGQTGSTPRSTGWIALVAPALHLAQQRERLAPGTLSAIKSHVRREQAGTRGFEPAAEPHEISERRSGRPEANHEQRVGVAGGDPAKCLGEASSFVLVVGLPEDRDDIEALGGNRFGREGAVALEGKISNRSTLHT